MIETANSSKLGLSGDTNAANTIFFLKNSSIFARKTGDFISGYNSIQNTVYGVNGPSFDSTTNSSFNTAIGYQSANTNAKQVNSIFMGNGAGYDMSSSRSIIIGNKSIVPIGTTKNMTDSVNIGTNTNVSTNANYSVVVGNDILNHSSGNVTIGFRSSTLAADSIVIGTENSNSGEESIVIGKKIKNSGSNSLLIYPKYSNGVSTEYVNEKDDYVNIFGIITGSNNKLNINQGVEFDEVVNFTKSISSKESILGSNIHVTTGIIDSNLYAHCNISDYLSVGSNAEFNDTLMVEGDSFFRSNVYVTSNIFIDNSNIRSIIETVSENTSNLNEQMIKVSSNLITSENYLRISIEDLKQKQFNDTNSLDSNVDNNTHEIEKNTSNLDFLVLRTDDLEFGMLNTVEGLIETQFDSIIQKAIDGTYIFNIIRDSSTNFPSFDETYTPSSETLFDIGPSPNLNRTGLVFPSNVWNEKTEEVIYSDVTTVNSLHGPNVILHDSNVFKAKTYFIDPVMHSNNVSFGSNVFIKGMIQSYGDYVTINDSLLVNDALHVGEYIESTAMKVNNSFANYMHCYCNLNFSNDWRMFTRENTENSNLKDLVFKGNHTVETSFTDFIPGQLNFTGQHRCSFSNVDVSNVSSLSGYIVSSTGSYCDINDENAIDIDDAIPIVALSTCSYDKKVFGIISDSEQNRYPGSDDKRCFQIGTMCFKAEKKVDSMKIIVNSVGEGGIWVCNQNGNIYNGDLIVSSDVRGVGMKQNDDIIRSYTVCKATCDAVFTCIGPSSRFIGCVYKI